MSNQCSEWVFSGARLDVRGHQCVKPFAVERDGKLYCKIHDPEYVARKRAEQDARWKAKSDADKRRYAISRVKEEIVEAAKALRKADATDIGRDLAELYLRTDELLALEASDG